MLSNAAKKARFLAMLTNAETNELQCGVVASLCLLNKELLDADRPEMQRRYDTAIERLANLTLQKVAVEKYPESYFQNIRL